MSSFKQVFIKLILLTLITFSTNVVADNHDKENKEEALPLNDPFVGDSSFSGGVKVITEGASSLSEQKKIDLYTYKLGPRSAEAPVCSEFALLSRAPRFH